MQRCKQCRAELKADDGFCPSCGTKVPTKEARKKARLVAIIVSIVVAVFLLTFISNLITGVSPTPTTTANQGSQSAATARRRATRVQSNPAETTTPSVANEPATQPQTACVPNWQCMPWGSCYTPPVQSYVNAQTGQITSEPAQAGQQTRDCWDANNCGVPTGKPATEQSC